MSDRILNGSVRTTCSYCSVGCGLEVTMSDGVASKLAGAKDYPVNLGKTCSKGFNLLKAYDAPDRGTTPLLRQNDGSMAAVDWDTASSEFAARFKAIQDKHGKASVAFISTGQIVIEEMVLLGAFAKFGMGLVHGDGNTRQCMASAATAYKQAFGFDSPPFTYADAEESDVLVFVGANPVIAHPILWQRVKNNPNQPKIVVIDPRQTETAKEASLHLAIHPKSDLYVLYAVANWLIQEGYAKVEQLQAHVADWPEFRDFVREFTIERAAQASGLSEETIIELARLIGAGERVSMWWTMGVNQSHQGTRTAQAIINICLLTGNIGRPGTGPNSITGQTNAMGSRLWSNTTALFGLRDFANSQDRQDVANILKLPVECIPDQPSWSYERILAGIDDGSIRGLWVICTNPAHSWIDRASFLERMKKLDYLVVQDIYHSTETAQLAHLYLPAAGSVEKNGTMINSERRLGIIRQVRQAPGLALSDFDIFHRLIKAWGCQELFQNWQTTEDVFAHIRNLSRGRPCDITGIVPWSKLEQEGGIQWPYPEGNIPTEQQRRLFADWKFFHPDGKAKMLYTQPQVPGEVPDASFPWWLLTGRGTMHQWHTQTRTAKVEMLRRMYPADAYVEINPADAQQLVLQDGDKVTVQSRRGAVTVNVLVRDSVQPGQIFMPMHYQETNWLTFPEFDTYSHQPSYKIGAVHLAKATGAGG